MAKKVKRNQKRKKVTPSKKSKPKRKKTIRDSSYHPALNKRFFSKVKQEFHDIDYAHTLDDKAKAFLASYMEEHLGARFNHSGKKLTKSKAGKQKVYNENNARQRDQYSIARATGRIVDISPELALAMWQERYVNHEATDPLEAVVEQPELLTLQEYTKLRKSGATIPDDLRMFYDALYFEDFILFKGKKA